MKRRHFLQLTAAASTSFPIAAKMKFRVNDNKKLPKWNPRRHVRKPNIVMVVLDDVGFGDLGCYGAEYKTKAIDSLAKDGVRFNNFHVTALCAPTRACLLTGRNAHAVGVGNIAEWGRDLPGYHGWIRKDAATLAEYLKPDGYTTLATGKWHLSAIHDQNGSGPYDHWPSGRGFDRWYGFHGNAMDHWHPEMFENTVAAYPAKSNDYHLSGDLVNRAINYIEDHISATPDNPFFLYLAFGACHFPLHVPADDIRRHKGKYDSGWDLLREQRFQRQQEIGIIPNNTKLAPRNPNIPAWPEMTGEQKRIAAYGQEVYAAFIEHTDSQIGCLVNFLKTEEQFKDTIFMVLSDNGATGSGGVIEGILDVRRHYYYEKESYEELARHYKLLGTDNSYGMHSQGWAQAGNTPLKWYKADTYGGGTRAPLIITWPNGNIGKNEIRTQYHHVIDVVPSLFEMINKPQNDIVNNNKILPIQGTSFAYSFDAPEAPTNKRIQYFETAGDRAIWVDGWKAVTRHTKGDQYEDDVWELYNTAHDFSEIDNLARREPELLQKLISLWHREARRDNVLPMEDDLFTLYKDIVPRARPKYTFYPGMTRLDRLSAPDILTYDSKWAAEVMLKNNYANGVILASGDSGAGYELFMQDGYLEFVYIYTRFKRYTLKSPQRIKAGKHVLGLQIHKTGERSANVYMKINGKRIASMHLPEMWQIFSPNSGIRCGENRHSPVSRNYQGHFPFQQTLKRVTVELGLK